MDVIIKGKIENSELPYREVLAVYDMNTHIRIQFKTNSTYYALYESYTLDIDKDIIDYIVVKP